MTLIGLGLLMTFVTNARQRAGFVRAGGQREEQVQPYVFYCRPARTYPHTIFFPQVLLHPYYYNINQVYARKQQEQPGRSAVRTRH